MPNTKTNKLNIVTKKLRPKKRRKAPKIRKKVSPFAVLAVISVLLLFTTLPFLHFRSERGAAVPEGARGFCLDLSHHNAGPSSWDSLYVAVDRSGRTVRDLKAARDIFPVKRIVLKATEGESMYDDKFRERWADAGKAGLERGAYHYFRSDKDPLRQAEHFIHTVGPLRHSDLSPVLDVEEIHKGSTSKELNDNALIWLETVEKHYGRKPVVYTPDSFARDILSKRIKETYPLWVAHYGVETPEYNDWKIWQFTDRAVVHGISGKVDLSVIR